MESWVDQFLQNIASHRHYYLLYETHLEQAVDSPIVIIYQGQSPSQLIYGFAGEGGVSFLGECAQSNQKHQKNKEAEKGGCGRGGV